MGWSEKAKAGGGGSVEGVITDYTFMDTFPFASDDNDDSKDNDNVYMLLEITVDGADEPVQRSLYLGSGQYLQIEEDGKVLKSTDDDGTPRLYDQGEVFKFIASLEEAGFPAEARFPDPEEEKVIDLRAMIGTRVRIANEVDEEATKKFGKRKVKKGKHKGKEFNRTYTKVTKVLALPDEGGNKAKAKAGAKAGSKVSKAKASKATAADEGAEGDDEEESSLTTKQADKMLVAVLKKQGKNDSIDKAGLPLAITRYFAATKGKGAITSEEERDALRRLVSDEDWLAEAAERGAVEFDASSKKQLVTAA
jgi:hypothetical protein